MQPVSKIEISRKDACRKMNRTRKRENVKALGPNIRDGFPFARLEHFRTVGQQLTREYDIEYF